MLPIERAELEKRQRLLLLSMFAVLFAFAALFLSFSLLASDFVVVLAWTPTAARVGVFLMALAFIALVWERNRELQRLAKILEQHEMETAWFESRLRMVETLLDASDRLGAPLLLVDVLRVVLETGMQLVPAAGGWVESLGGSFDERLHQRYESPPQEGASLGTTWRLPLVCDGRPVGSLGLVLPAEVELGRERLDLLHCFATQASRAVEKGRLFTDERASLVHLQAASAVRSRFLSTVSHELRTPLTSIIGYAATLEAHWRKLDQGKRGEFLRAIVGQGKTLSRIIDRMIEASKLESGGAVIRPVLHDVRNSVRHGIEAFEEERLRVNLPSVPVVAEADPEVIRQVISNLVDNALRYTEGSIGIGLRSRRDDFVISISDRGDGFDRDEVRRTAATLGSPSEYSTGGAGLGLHIVETLVTAHSGRLETDRRGQGTTIRVVLPRRIAPRAIEFPSMTESSLPTTSK